MDSRGQKEEVEAAGYEVRQFCEMLLKGAVNIFEVRRRGKNQSVHLNGNPSSPFTHLSYLNSSVGLCR